MKVGCLKPAEDVPQLLDPESSLTIEGEKPVNEPVPAKLGPISASANPGPFPREQNEAFSSGFRQPTRNLNQ